MIVRGIVLLTMSTVAVSCTKNSDHAAQPKESSLQLLMKHQWNLTSIDVKLDDSTWANKPLDDYYLQLSDFTVLQFHQNETADLLEYQEITDTAGKYHLSYPTLVITSNYYGYFKSTIAKLNDDTLQVSRPLNETLTDDGTLPDLHINAIRETYLH